MPLSEFDIVVFGASGFTGKLVVEHLAKRLANSGVRWALAGRRLDKLDAARQEAGAPTGLPLVQVDSTDIASVQAMVSRTRLVLTTVGPYQYYGSHLLAACVSRGVDYVDLCGEPAWMRQMIDTHEAAAENSGSRIVFSCGFDSIPFELGVFVLQKEAMARFDRPYSSVKARVRTIRGGLSGGTAASLRATTKSAQSDPTMRAIINDPFALTPGFRGPDQPPGDAPRYDDKLGAWLAPFIMSPINTRNVHRSNALLQHAYGAEFVYDEMLVTGPGERGRATAMKIAKSSAISEAPPGSGPTRAEREAGCYNVLFTGEREALPSLRLCVSGDIDPGYALTATLIGECALCLSETTRDAPPGIWTPVAAMKEGLVERLKRHTRLVAEFED